MSLPLKMQYCMVPAPRSDLFSLRWENIVLKSSRFHLVRLSQQQSAGTWGYQAGLSHRLHFSAAVHSYTLLASASAVFFLEMPWKLHQASGPLAFWSLIHS